eukprot:m.472461 g.472461  ORF g.472461 m.472461 type:complete len:51 (+) comp32739_c0_seq1:131-283(+)
MIRQLETASSAVRLVFNVKHAERILSGSWEQGVSFLSEPMAQARPEPPCA